MRAAHRPFGRRPSSRRRSARGVRRAGGLRMTGRTAVSVLAARPERRMPDETDRLDSAGSLARLSSLGRPSPRAPVRRTTPPPKSDGCDAFAWPVSNERAWFDQKTLRRSVSGVRLSRNRPRGRDDPRADQNRPVFPAAVESAFARQLQRRRDVFRRAAPRDLPGHYIRQRRDRRVRKRDAHRQTCGDRGDGLPRRAQERALSSRSRRPRSRSDQRRAQPSIKVAFEEAPNRL